METWSLNAIADKMDKVFTEEFERICTEQNVCKDEKIISVLQAALYEKVIKNLQNRRG